MNQNIGTRCLAIRERVERAASRSGRRIEDITVVAVAKKKPPGAVVEAVQAGFHHIGENYVQELRSKQSELEGVDVVWHMTGRLQHNKAKDVVGNVALIHSVDSEKLARKLNDRATATDIVQDVLLQVNLVNEATKAGVDPNEVPQRLEFLEGLKSLRCVGLMTMPPFVEDAEINRPHFRRLATLARHHGLAHVSMGMTADFEVAIEEGSTLVRIGTAIFGARS